MVNSRSYLDWIKHTMLTQPTEELNAEAKALIKKQRDFLQAVIDDKKDLVRKMLDAMPELLCMTPPSNLVIKSNYTWQKFYAENAIAMAIRRKQLSMTELLLEYLNSFPQSEEVVELKANALMLLEAAHSQDRQAIPPHYTELINALISVFANEQFPYGNKVTATLSAETEDALQAFRESTLPEHTVKLDDYFDIELLLYLAYAAYVEQNLKFKDWAQCKIYSIKVIGFLQSLVTPDTARIFCAGLSNIIQNKQEIGEHAQNLTLLGDEPYYRQSRAATQGLGYDFVLGRRVYIPYDYFAIAEESAPLLDQLRREKAARFAGIMQDLRYQLWNVEADNLLKMR